MVIYSTQFLYRFFLETIDFIGIHFIYLAYINADFLNKHNKNLKKLKKEKKEEKVRQGKKVLGNTHTEM